MEEAPQLQFFRLVDCVERIVVVEARSQLNALASADFNVNYITRQLASGISNQVQPCQLHPTPTARVAIFVPISDCEDPTSCFVKGSLSSR